MNVSIICEKVKVLVRPGHVDVVTIETNIPSTIWVGHNKPPRWFKPTAMSVFRIEQAYDTGAEWVRKNLKVEPEVIEVF